MAKNKEREPKAPILRWRGLFADESRVIRIVGAVLLALLLTMLSFTQLGFVHLMLPGGESAYIVALLEVVALGSLLLGPITGTILGVYAGIIMHIHSVLMPLDPYELYFVTPVTSVAMLGVSGLILGIFFALALRHNPAGPRRYIRLALVCVVVSLLYSALFLTGVTVQLLESIVQSAEEMTSSDAISVAAEEEAARLALQLGSLRAQAGIDAILMFVVCAACDAIMGRMRGVRENIGMRLLFGSGMGAVFLGAFMVTTIVGFVSISISERNAAYEDMRDECNYLINQLQDYNQRVSSLTELLRALEDADLGISDEDLDLLARQYSTDSLLQGYLTDSDGFVFIVYDTGYEGGEFIQQSNDPKFSSKGWLSDYLDQAVIDAIYESIETDTPQRVVFADFTAEYNEESGHVERTITDVDLAYLMAMRSNERIVVMIRPFPLVFESRWMSMTNSIISSIVLLLAVFLLTFYLLGRVALRIDETNEVMGHVRAGDLDARIEVRNPRELASLSEGINETVGTLKGLIAEAETRMDAELATAKTIQESALPQVFPPYPNVMSFDIYATMNAAREVGGDFYDFFLIGDDADFLTGKLGFVVADVSGKGVPAALFMMRAKALIRDYLSSGVEPGEAVENANRQLCEGNEAGMFVTAWVGVLDYSEGHLGHIEFVNAGHNPPLLWQDGSWRWLKERSGLPLGLFDGLPYRTHSIECTVGDQFLIYTDGVTEAMDTGQVLYGEDRLMQVAQENFAVHPRELVEAVRRDVARYAQGAEQSDDITIMALEVGVPPEVTATLVVPARLDQFERVTEFIHTELDRRFCPKRAQNQLDIAFEELFVNVASYAYPDATEEDPGTVRVSYTYSAEPPSVIVTIADDGAPYDPLAKPDAVTPTDIMDVPIGGLGILMAKKSVDDMSYQYRDGSNVVTITKKW